MNELTGNSGRCTRPHQSGMEKKHEEWVLQTLNFLQLHQIDFYTKDAYGNRVPGKDKEIPERLNDLSSKISSMRNQLNEVYKERSRLQKDFDEANTRLKIVLDCLTKKSPKRSNEAGTVKAVEVLSNYFAEKYDTTGTKSNFTRTDERGVTNIHLDAREVMIRLGLDNITHDFAPGERRCGACWGLGIVKRSSPYGLGERKPNEEPFPYKHEWLSDCPNCYMGKEKFCRLKDCGKATPRGRILCDCDGQRAIDAEKRKEKEAKRREGLKRIALSEYKEPLVYDDEYSEFVDIDDIEERLEEHPDSVLFACSPQVTSISSYAGDILDIIEERACDDMRPEDEDAVIDIHPGAAQSFKELLEEWEKKPNTVSFRSLWYPNMDLIVEVKDV